MRFNPRRHFWAAARAHSLLGATLKAAIDALHPSEDDNDPIEAPPQVVVASKATADGADVAPGTIIIVQQHPVIDATQAAAVDSAPAAQAGTAAGITPSPLASSAPVEETPALDTAVIPSPVALPSPDQPADYTPPAVEPAESDADEHQS